MSDRTIILTFIFLIACINSYTQDNFAIQGYVIDTLINSELKNSSVQLISDKGEIRNTQTDVNGVLNFVSIPIDHDFIVLASKDGYLKGKERITKADIHSDSIVQAIIYLQRISINRSMPIIKFELESYDLDSSDFWTIKTIKDLITDNPNIAIEIGGHRDNNEKPETSRLRCEIVEEGLLKMGIQPDRLLVGDYGNNKPACVDYRIKMENPILDLDSCLTNTYLLNLDTDIQKTVTRENRRVEFIILRNDFKE